MKSCLLVGNVEHVRIEPINHSFNYKVLYYFLDIDQVQKIFKFPFLFSYNSSGILSFRRKNYFGNSKDEISTSIKNYIYQQTRENFHGKIFILTNISYFGFCFNPVSFYYCYDEKNQLKYIISEITNTPWGEKHSNFFKFVDNNHDYCFKKDFHVSPFIPMEVNYRWNFSQTEEKMEVRMENFYNEQKSKFFHAYFSLKPKELSLKNLVKYFFLYPLMTFKIIWGIYFQALLLFLKKAPFYSHPAKEQKI